MDGLSKTRRSGPARQVFYPRFEDCRDICPAATLSNYESRTATFRGKTPTENGGDPLFISFVKPHRQVSSSTISRWLKDTLEEAGIDVSIFKAHSTRAAATSAAAQAGVGTKDILRAANWTQESTFQRFYRKPVEGSKFGEAILNGMYTSNIHCHVCRITMT